MSRSSSETNDWEVSNTKNTVRLAYWTGAWLVSIALVAFGPKFLWEFYTPLTVAAIVVSLGIGLGMILATIRHLKGLDEMHQKIFLEASALSLGVGLVFGSSYKLLEDVKIIAFEPQISHLIMLMSLTLLTANIIGCWRYR